MTRYIHLNPLRAGIIKNLNELEITSQKLEKSITGSLSNKEKEHQDLINTIEEAEKIKVLLRKIDQKILSKIN